MVADTRRKAKTAAAADKKKKKALKTPAKKALPKTKVKAPPKQRQPSVESQTEHEDDSDTEPEDQSLTEPEDESETEPESDSASPPPGAATSSQKAKAVINDDADSGPKEDRKKKLTHQKKAEKEASDLASREALAGLLALSQSAGKGKQRQAEDDEEEEEEEDNVLDLIRNPKGAQRKANEHPPSNTPPQRAPFTQALPVAPTSSVVVDDAEVQEAGAPAVAQDGWYDFDQFVVGRSGNFHKVLKGTHFQDDNGDFHLISELGAYFSSPEKPRELRRSKRNDVQNMEQPRSQLPVVQEDWNRTNNNDDDDEHEDGIEPVNHRNNHMVVNYGTSDPRAPATPQHTAKRSAGFKSVPLMTPAEVWQERFGMEKSKPFNNAAPSPSPSPSPPSPMEESAGEEPSPPPTKRRKSVTKGKAAKSKKRKDKGKSKATSKGRAVALKKRKRSSGGHGESESESESGYESDDVKRRRAGDDGFQLKTGRKIAVTEFTPRSQRLGQVFKDNARKHVALTSLFPIDIHVSIWNETGQSLAGEAPRGQRLRQQELRDTFLRVGHEEQDDVKAALLQYGNYAAETLRGELKVAAKAQLNAFYNIPGDRTKREIEKLVAWLLTESRFHYGQLNHFGGDEDGWSCNVQMPFKLRCLAPIISKEYCTTKTSNRLIMQEMVKKKVVPAGIVCMVVTALENALGEWRTGQFIKMDFSMGLCNDRYERHMALWRALAVGTPSFMIMLQEDLFSDVMRGSNNLHIEDVNDALLPVGIDMEEMERQARLSMKQSDSIENQLIAASQEGSPSRPLPRRSSFPGVNIRDSANQARKVTFGEVPTPTPSKAPLPRRRESSYVAHAVPESPFRIESSGYVPSQQMPPRVGGSSHGPDTLRGDEMFARQMQDEGDIDLLQGHQYLEETPSKKVPKHKPTPKRRALEE